MYRTVSHYERLEPHPGTGPPQDRQHLSILNLDHQAVSAASAVTDIAKGRALGTQGGVPWCTGPDQPGGDDWPQPLPITRMA